MNFGIILGGFWHHFGSPNAFKNRVKFWMRFWNVKVEPELVKEGRPGGMRGGPGEDNGGVREPISAENRSRGSKAGARSSSIASSTPSPVGRRIAPRIPPGWGYYPNSVVEARSAVQRRVAQQYAYMWVWLRPGAISSPALKKLEQRSSVTHI